MPTIFRSAVGAKVIIAADDHCPPHVHVWHRGEEWVVRMTFSFIDQRTNVLTIVPSEGEVSQRQLNTLAEEIAAHLPACRAIWWKLRGTTCLENQKVLMRPSGGYALTTDERPDAKRIALATYDTAEQALAMRFWGGGAATMPVGEGAIS